MQIIGYEKEKKDLLQLKDMLLNAKTYSEKGVRIPKGLILSGDPGVGKTKMALSLISDGINLVELKAADVNDDPAIAIVSAFKRAKENAPAVLLIEELDKIAGGSPRFMQDENDAVGKILLCELDSIMPDDMVLVVATCNSIRFLSDALSRPGRFDRIIEIPRPDTDTRKAILEAYFSNLSCPVAFDFDEIAKMTSGESGAELECLVNETGIYAISNNLKEITYDDVRKVLNKQIFNGFEKTFADIESLRRVAAHEAGHAVIAYTLKPDEFFGASVVPQGDSAGHVMCSHNSRDMILSCEEVEKTIMIALAGHVSEKLVLNRYMTGSSSDLSKAVSFIKRLIRDGAYGYEYLVPMLNKETISSGEKVDNFIAGKLISLDSKVTEMLTEHRNELNAVIDALIKDHIVTKEKMNEIFNVKCEIRFAA